MLVSHHADVINNHMAWLNWNKWSKIVPVLSRQLEKAHVEMHTAVGVLDKMTRTIPDDLVVAWKAMEAAAQARQDQGDVEGMHLYDVSIEKAPTCAEILFRLAEAESKTRGCLPGTASWLVECLKVEEVQVALEAHACCMGRAPTKDALNKLRDRRVQLANRINAVKSESAQFLQAESHQHMNSWVDMDIPPRNVGADEVPIYPEDSDEEADPPGLLTLTEDIPSELHPLPLPSYMTAQQLEHLGLQRLTAQELELREAQMSTAIEEIQTSQGQKSIIFRKERSRRPFGTTFKCMPGPDEWR
ncbi:hypothetical protein OF83DRAFT_1176559 [Amylostereum chailletii]|nr:hypothetical protein OF83DRAFT_1176559 [Amylostereum chailletii]